MTKLVVEEINQIVEENSIKSPTEFDMHPSLNKNTKKALKKLLTDNGDVFATSDVDLKYPPTIMKMHIDTGDHKHIALKLYRKPIAHIKW